MQTKRLLLFLIGCIGLRTALVFIAKYGDKNMVFLLACVALMISLGFFTIYFTGMRKTGPETFGDKIWWNDLRPLHGFLYLLFALFAFQQKSYAWVVLALDVIIGLTAFIVFHTASKKQTSS